ncbi:MAG: hypothetical protein WAU45_05040, partial [Blastocatellia bacterium]
SWDDWLLSLSRMRENSSPFCVGGQMSLRADEFGLGKGPPLAEAPTASNELKAHMAHIMMVLSI